MENIDDSVSMTAVIPGTVQVKARDIRLGDTVFGPNGEEDTVSHVSISSDRAVITPMYRWPLHCKPDDTVTVRRHA